jgi:ribosomal protein S18 acetylase RimI-like enzyme
MPTIGIEVRRALPSEGGAVGALTERTYRAGGWTDDRYAAVLRDGWARIVHAEVLVALAGDVLAGTVTLARPDTPLGSFCAEGELEMRMLAVDEASRGQGVAGALLEACAAFARGEDARAIVLATEPDMHAAHRLYERHGYVRDPGPDRRFDRFELLAYRLDLTGG